MWASLETWLIGDGQFPQLELGAVVRDCGLRLNCSRLRSSSHALEGVSAVRLDEVGRARYGLTGRCQTMTSPLAALLAFPDWLAVAEPEEHRVVHGARDLPAYEPWSEQFRAPTAGQMVDAEGWLEVVADHEWEAFSIPDSRMNWRLDGIQLLEHRLVCIPGEPPESRTFGPVVRVTHPRQLSWTADKLEGARYLVDLVPA